MMRYSKENFEDLVLFVSEQLGFSDEFIHDYIVEFCFADNIPSFRLVYVEATGIIAVCFHVDLIKTDAFAIMSAIKSNTTEITLGEEYIVDSNNQTLVGQEAYAEYERQIEDRVIPPVLEEFTYIPDYPIILSIPYATYHAQDPRSKETQKQLEEQRRWRGKFKWDD